MAVSPTTFQQRRQRSLAASFLIPKHSPANLLRVLHLISAEISTLSPPPPPLSLFKRNSTAIIRKCEILTLIFDEILCCTQTTLDSLSASSLLCFEEMFIVLQRIKVLIEDCSSGRSKMWLLMQTESTSSYFHELTLDLRTLLEILPRNELNLSEDIEELCDLVIKQCQLDKSVVEPADNQLRLTLLLILDSVKREVVPDSVLLGETFARLGLINSVRCREEIELLQDEFWIQRDDKSKAEVVALVGLLRYAKCVLFGGSTPSFSESSQWNSSSLELSMPRGFRCPITHDLMTDPIIVSTGQTYDRSSIPLWVESGQTIDLTIFIPNRALKSLIALWCRENRVPYVAADDSDCLTGTYVSRVALEATKMTVSYLLGKLGSRSGSGSDLGPGTPGTAQEINNLVYELRVLAKTGADNRACIGEAGAIPLLVQYLHPENPKLQVNAVTTLLNLSILEANKGRIMETGSASNGVIEVLRSGATWEAKANAAATIFSLSGVGAYRKKLGKKIRVVKGLLELAREGPSSCKRDALVAILTLAGDREIAERLVEGGVIDTIKEIMGELSEEAMTILETVVKNGGLVAVAAVGDMIGSLVAVLRTGTDRTKESAIATLVIICRRGGDEMAAEVAKVSAVEMVIWELMGNGTTRAKRKAASLMRMLRRWAAGLEGDVLEELSMTMALQICNDNCFGSSLTKSVILLLIEYSYF